MPAARKDDCNLDESLPDPRLNPMINPRLAKNLGRWASVYYTTPPEKREQAVLELVRELEGAPSAGQELVGPAHDEASTFDKDRPPVAMQEPVAHPPVPEIGAIRQRFCGICGSPLMGVSPPKLDDCGEPEQHSRPFLAVLPAPAPLLDDRDAGNRLIEEQAAETRRVGEKRPSRKHVLLVLFASAALGAWGVWRIRLDPVLQTPSRPAPIVHPVTRQPQPNFQPRVVQKETVASVPRMQASPLGAVKPAAGKPLECDTSHLANCPAEELYRRTMTLADGIDTRFVEYDKRMTQLLRNTTGHPSDSAERKQNRSRQANYSAQMWEQLQLRTYASQDRKDVLKLRAELIRRAIARPSDAKPISMYDHPQSCLDLHYVAMDLRKLAEKLRRSQNTVRASARRTASASTR